MTSRDSKAFWLGQLRWVAGLTADLPLSRQLAIREARSAGATDTEIGAALGVSRQAVAKAVPR